MLTYIYNFFFPTESEYIQSLRKRKKEICADLSNHIPVINNSTWFRFYFSPLFLKEKELYLHDPQSVIIREIFLSYCHYLHFHRNENDINLILVDHNKLNFFLSLQEQNSPLVSVLLSKSSIEIKRRYINILPSYGFTKTKEYNMMSQLILYDNISQRKYLPFLNIELLPETKNYIMSLVIELYKDQLLCCS